MPANRNVEAVRVAAHTNPTTRNHTNLILIKADRNVVPVRDVEAVRAVVPDHVVRDRDAAKRVVEPNAE